jgi:hypothetical protein
MTSSIDENRLLFLLCGLGSAFLSKLDQKLTQIGEEIVSIRREPADLRTAQRLKSVALASAEMGLLEIEAIAQRMEGAIASGHRIPVTDRDLLDLERAYAATYLQIDAFVQQYLPAEMRTIKA